MPLLATDPHVRIGILTEMLDVFGLREYIAWILAPGTEAEKNERLEVAKAEAKTAFRSLAKHTHPDRGGNDEQFRQVRNVYDELQRFELFPTRVVCHLCHGTGFIANVQQHEGHP